MSSSIINSLYKEALPSLMADLGLKSPMAVPKISKVTLNMGLGAEAINDRKVVENAMEELRLISGQQPIKTNARRSVASFKLREGFTIGCKVTLRGNLIRYKKNWRRETSCKIEVTKTSQRCKPCKTSKAMSDNRKTACCL